MLRDAYDFARYIRWSSLSLSDLSPSLLSSLFAVISIEVPGPGIVQYSFEYIMPRNLYI